MTTYTFFAKTDIVVIDTDGEHADMDNPRGEIYGHAAYVVAEDEETGRRFQCHVKTARWEDRVRPQAEKMATALNARFKSMGKMPVAFERWEETDANYCSQAGREQEHAEFMAEKMADYASDIDFWPNGG
jgi:hypothetical protein